MDKNKEVEGVPELVHALSSHANDQALHTTLLRLATRDALTGLPNRDLLLDRLTQAIAMGERGHFVVATAVIKIHVLDQNTSSPRHQQIEALLNTMATGLSANTRKCDTVARLAGGEFVLVTLHNTILAADAPARPAAEGGYYSYVRDTVAKIQRVLSDTIALDDVPLDASCSIGVSIYPQDGHDADTLLLHADAAMRSAERNGSNRVKFYTGDPLD